MTDLISRQAAINELKRISFSHWFECGEYISEDVREIEIINSNKALEAIEELPSAYPKKGKWIKADRQQYFRKHYPASQCSICGWRKNYSGKYNYCPNCGAKME